jgi:hypothetical protein
MPNRANTGGHEMASVRNVLIAVDLQTGVMVGAGNTVSEAETGVFNTSGPIVLSQRPLIDEIFCKILKAVYGGQKTIDLKTTGKKIVRDDSFPLPCIDQHVASALAVAGADPHATALELIRSIVEEVPAKKASGGRKKRSSGGKKAPKKHKDA